MNELMAGGMLYRLYNNYLAGGGVPEFSVLILYDNCAYLRCPLNGTCTSGGLHSLRSIIIHRTALDLDVGSGQRVLANGVGIANC